MQTEQSSRLAAAGWWALTIALLVVLDDLTYGPVFWLLGVTVGVAAVLVAFTIYFVVQIYLVAEGTKETPSRAASAVLRRLRLARRSEEVELREMRLHQQVTGVFAAIVLAPFIGGVLPPLILARRGWERRAVLGISVVTSAIYAAEFAFLHAYIPSTLAS